ncbi:MAG: hypothetical protein AB7Q27_01105 [Acidimicrobiia bacterium]
MATIVGGLGTSHSPQLSMPGSTWSERAEWDRTTTLFSFADAATRAPAGILDEITEQAFEANHARCQAAITRLHELLVGHAPDVVVVVGDDQNEMFLDDGYPAVAILRADTLIDAPRPLDSLHPSSRRAEWAYHGTEAVERPGAPELAWHIVAHLSQSGFDVTQLARQPEGRSLGHAFTFVQRRLMGDHIVPVVPIMINTDHAPNIPTPRRCLEIGAELRAAIDSWDSDQRVLLVASGGLSHFEVDAVLDRHVLDAIGERDHEALANLPVERLVLGTAEIRNWIIVAAALADGYEFNLIDYVAAYRSEAATGCGMGFAEWRAADHPCRTNGTPHHEQQHDTDKEQS